MADLLERKTCVSRIVLMTSSARAVSPLMMTLRAVHAHVRVVREEHVPRAGGKIKLAGRASCLGACVIASVWRDDDLRNCAAGFGFTLMTRHAINNVFVFVIDLPRHCYVTHGCLVRGFGGVGHVTRDVAVVATDAQRLIVAVHQSADLTGGHSLERFDVLEELLCRLVLRKDARSEELTGSQKAEQSE